MTAAGFWVLLALIAFIVLLVSGAGFFAASIVAAVIGSGCRSNWR